VTLNLILGKPMQFNWLKIQQSSQSASKRLMHCL